MSIDSKWPPKPGKTGAKKQGGKKASNRKIKMELNEKTETTQPINRQIESLPYHIGKETTMTEEREIGLDDPMTDVADTHGWSQLTFTCPECGSHKLWKCMGDVSGQVDHNEVVEIHYKREDWEDADEDDVEDTEVLVQFRPGDIGTWDLGADDESFLYFWYRCAECDYPLVDEDGHLPGDDVELAQWLIRNRREPSDNSNTFENRS